METTRACLDRIGRWNDLVHAFCHVDGEAALAAAHASEARWLRGEPVGLLDGVPATIKDLVLTRGWTARRGSHTTAGHPPAAVDAPATARLREAGAVLLGSTTTPEFGWKGVTDNPLGHIARNPWDVARTPGGSSGGAGVAAALGMGALHIGTDGGGSIRIPASFCGIVGLKPSFGRVPAWPLSPFGTVAHLGPMTRTVDGRGPDADRDQPAGHPRLDVAAGGGHDYRIGLDGGLAGLRIAASPALGFVEVEPASGGRLRCGRCGAGRPRRADRAGRPAGRPSRAASSPAPGFRRQRG